MESKTFIFLFLLIIFGDCKDPYQFKIANFTRSLIVDGSISAGPGPHYLKLHTLAVQHAGLIYGSQRPPDPVTGALVTITDETGNKESYQEVGKGKYQLNSVVVKGRKKGTYFIEIKLLDGSIYRSTSEEMPIPQAKDSVYWKLVKEKIISTEGVSVVNNNIKVWLNSSLSHQEGLAYFRWAIDEVYSLYSASGRDSHYCYVYQDVSVSNTILLNTADFSGSNIKSVLLQTRTPDFTFAFRHYFNVTQYAMNKKTYDYWKKINLLTTRTGSIFDTPPAKVNGNIYNIDNKEEFVYGYFEASAQNITRVFVDRGYIPFEIGTCYCQDCLSLAGSTIVMPYWFW